MDKGTVSRRNNKKTQIIKRYRGQEVVEIHNRLHSEGTRHIKKICESMSKDKN